MSNSTLRALVLSSLLLSVSPALAGKDAGAGNGGDICEDRIKIVRDDIASWIKKGGSSGLKLPHGIDAKQYEASMLNAIIQAKVSCTDEVITVGHAEKTCKNFIDNDVPRVLCDAKKFLGTDESAQYILVHHEYAGLSGIEINNGEDSNYGVSNQISGFLVDEVVKKLAVGIPPSGLCSTLDVSKPIPVGMTCMTSKGKIFERIEQKDFGKAWKGPDGLIWSDQIGTGNQYDAVKICKRVGGSLPSAYEFSRGEADGFREALPHMKNSSFWTSSIDYNFMSPGIYGYIFQTDDHEMSIGFREHDEHSVRCVVQDSGWVFPSKR